MNGVLNGILVWLSGPGGSHLAWTLLHTLWEGAVIAVVLWSVLRRTGGRRGGVRYGLSVATLAGVVLAGFVTWAILNDAGRSTKKEASPNPAAATGTMQTAISKAGVSVARPPERIAATRSTQPLEKGTPLQPLEERAQQGGGSGSGNARTAAPVWTRWALAAWMIGVVLMLLRMGRQLLGAGRLRNQCRRIEDVAIAVVVDGLRQSMGIARRVGVTAGDAMVSPAVIGVVWPTILLPAAVLAGVTPDQLRLILAHELAHIRRHDYLVNVGQLVVEAVLFFNPAVWWISRQVRVEREACCDAAAAAATGEPVEYAKTLMEFSTHYGGSRDLAATVALRFAGDRKSDKNRGDSEPKGGNGDSGLLDRVERLLVPSHPPHLHLPWYSLLASFVVAVVALVGLWQGTWTAVAVASDILSPRQRMERLEEISKTHNRLPETDSRNYRAKENVTMSGTVRTEDGLPLPKRTFVYLDSNRRGSVSGKTIEIHNGAFSTSIEYGAIYLRVSVAGYADSISGPFNPKPGGSVGPVEIVLTHGVPVEIHVEGPDGHPVAGATIEYNYVVPTEGLPYGPPLRTDEHGIAVFEHYSKLPVHMRLQAKGYQSEVRTPVTLQQGKPYLWKAKRAKPTSGVVIASKTGNPVSGAKIRLFGQEEGSSIGGFGQLDALPLLAETNAKGRFTITTLNDGTLYFVIVQHKGFSRAFPPPIIAGQTGVNIGLKPELYIAGKVLAPPDRLNPWNVRNMGTIQYIFRFQDLGPLSTSETSSVTGFPLELRDGTGYFRIGELWPGEFTLSVGGIDKTIDLKTPINDLVFDLRKPAKAKPVNAKDVVSTRELILRFDTPPGMPPPEGTLRVTPLTRTYTTGSDVYPVVNGEVRLVLPVPERVSISPEGLLGYWFSPNEKYAYVAVAAGEGPFVHDLPAIAAGAIDGRVLNPDGSPADGFKVYVNAVTKPSAMGDRMVGIAIKELSRPHDGISTFMATPLPLGGTYRIILQRGADFLVGDPVPVDEAHPIQHVEYTIPRGIPVEVQVLDPEGSPLGGKRVRLRLQLYHPRYGPGGFSRFTAAEGNVVFESVNPNVPGDYFIDVPSWRRYQPIEKRIVPGKGSLQIRLKYGEVITGTVVDFDTGQPVPGVQVFAKADPPSMEGEPFQLWAEKKTDAAGAFRFSSLRNHKYKLGVMGEDVAGNLPVVTGGQSEPVVLRIHVPR